MTRYSLPAAVAACCSLLVSPAFAHCWTAPGAAGIGTAGSEARLVRGQVTRVPVVAPTDPVPNLAVPYAVGDSFSIEDAMLSLAAASRAGIYSAQYSMVPPSDLTVFHRDGPRGSLGAWVFVGDPDLDRVVVQLKSSCLFCPDEEGAVRTVAILDSAAEDVSAGWTQIAAVFDPPVESVNIAYFVEADLITDRAGLVPTAPGVLVGPAVGSIHVCAHRPVD